MFVDLPHYPETRPSPVPWAPVLPDGWEVKRGKALFKRIVRPTRPEDGVVTCFRDGVVTLRSRRRTTGYTESLKEIGYQGVRKGDLVIHAMDAFAGAVGVSDSDGKSTPVYSVCVPRATANPHYFAAVVRDMARSSWILALSKGIRERSTDFRFEMFGTQMLPVPPADEQAAIVKYVAHANARIGRAIGAKRRLIALLEEQRVALAKGVMDVRGARLVRTKDVCERIVDCKNRTPGFVETGKFHVVRTTCVRGGQFSMVGSYPTDNANFIEWTERGAPRAGDVFFTREAPVGEAALVPDRHDLCLGQRMMYFRPDASQVLSEYLLLAIYATPARTFIDVATNGSTVGHLRVGDVGALPLLLPALDEQRRIVDSYEARSSVIRRTRTRVEREIDLLREFRARLVADVVTGQVDVRAIAASLPDIEAAVNCGDSESAEHAEASED